VHTVGTQLSEPLRTHHGLSKAAAREQAAELLARVGVPEPRSRLDDYPHQFSGGMAQRVAIAMALSCRPKILIADEPTTALDVTTQSQVLDLLIELQQELAMAILLITHDLGVVAQVCDRAAVMYAGEIVEVGAAAALLEHPRHPYTAALLAANPGRGRTNGRLPTIPGRVPHVGEWPSGCRFAPRCAYATDACVQARVSMVGGVRCIRADELAAGLEEAAAT
jgi:oligopeptide/dipeptide ABC transporter ATP-binding protein